MGSGIVGDMGLHRSRHDRIFGGVCGGIANSLGWSSTRVRVLYVIASILSAAFPGTLVYLVLWLVIPLEP
jgi:phage shock protein PspC (stress-responsive transcriptional regulator)